MPRTAISMMLVIQLLLTSTLGPIALCLCSDGCVTIVVEDDGCCPTGECCPTVPETVIGADLESCCDWWVTIPGDVTPKLVSSTSMSRVSTAAWTALLPAAPPRRALDQFCSDRTAMATGPPAAIARLRTVRLLV